MFRAPRSLLALLAVVGLPLAAADVPGAAKATPYPFTSCIVSGEPLGDMGDPYVEAVEGREVKFCCKGCLKAFKKDQATYLATIDTGAKAKADGQVPVNPAEKPSEKPAKEGK